jgi:hypothetical protein
LSPHNPNKSQLVVAWVNQLLFKFTTTTAFTPVHQDCHNRTQNIPYVKIATRRARDLQPRHKVRSAFAFFTGCKHAKWSQTGRRTPRSWKVQTRPKLQLWSVLKPLSAARCRHWAKEPSDLAKYRQVCCKQISRYLATSQAPGCAGIGLKTTFPLHCTGESVAQI